MEKIIISGGADCFAYEARGEELTSGGVDRFVEFCRDNGVDALVALGGGSTI